MADGEPMATVLQAPPRPSFALTPELIAKLVRCMAVSVIVTTLSLTMLGVLVGVVHMAAVPANVVTTLVASVPSYVLNRRWVWKVTGRSDLRRQVLPFWGLAMAGLVLSSVAVGVTAHVADGMDVSGTVRTLGVQAANLAAWGLLWVIQFVALDRWLFHDPDVVVAVPA
jgi:putative flippase GtrA